MMRIIFILLSILLGSFAIGQNSAVGQHYFTTELTRDMASMLNNPAFYFFHPDSSFSDVSLQWEKDKAKGLYHIQTGNAHTAYLFHAQSLLKKKKEVLWGSAAYKNEQIEGVKWSNVADAALVYPYIVADTIVRTSYGEHYYFNGGCAVQFNKLSIGGEAHYRSGLEYRKLDPRPKSTISDLKISMGASLPIGRHRMGLYLKYGAYKQEHIINIYRLGGGSKIFYLKGMGVSDEGFSTVLSSNDRLTHFYEIKIKEGGVPFYPNTDRGLFALTSFKRSDLDLQLESIEKINELKSRYISTEFGYFLSDDHKEMRFKIYGTLTHKKGYDFNYNQSKILISKLQKYTQQNHMLGISGLTMVNHNAAQKWFAKLDAYYTTNQEKYFVSMLALPALQKYHFFNSKADLCYSRTIGKSLVSIKVSVSYQQCLSKELETSPSASETANETFILPDYLYLTSNKTNVSPEVRYERKLDAKYGLYIKAQQFNEIYEAGSAFCGFSIAFGLTL